MLLYTSISAAEGEHQLCKNIAQGRFR